MATKLKSLNKQKTSASKAKKTAKPLAKAKPALKSARPAAKILTKAKPAPKKVVKSKASVKAKPVKKAVAKKAPVAAKKAVKNIKSKVVAKTAKKPVAKVPVKKTAAKSKAPVKAVKSVKKVVKAVAKKVVKKAAKPAGKAAQALVIAKNKTVKTVKPVKLKLEKPVKIKAEKPVKVKAEKPIKIKVEKPKKEKKVKPPKEEKIKRVKKPIIVKRVIEPTGAVLNRFIEYKEEMKKENEQGNKPSHSPVSKYIRFELEHPFNASPRLLYECFTTPSGFAEWFADDVNIKNDIYTFYWDGAQQNAELISLKENKMARYRWLDEPKDIYFEFRIQIDELTGDVALIITDFAENERERDASTLLWNTQIEALHHAIGAY